MYKRQRLICSSTPKDVTARAIFTELKDVFGWADDSSLWSDEFFAAILERSTDAKAQISQGQ